MRLTNMFGVLAVVVCLATVAWGQKTWRYADFDGRGPTTWSRMVDVNGAVRYPQCGSTQQSPIDIASAPTDPALRPLNIVWAATHNLTVVNDGRALLLYAGDVQLNLEDPNTGILYEVADIQMKSPSEHTFGGGRRDMELQFKLRKQVPSQTAGATFVVVSVTFVAGEASVNDRLNDFFSAIPALPIPLADVYGSQQNVESRRTAQVPGTFDFGNIFPATRDYYTYQGSLSHPPCTQGVTWYVLTQPVHMSTVQLTHLRTMMQFAEEARITNQKNVAFRVFGNYRPSQGTLKTRTIRKYTDSDATHPPEIDSDENDSFVRALAIAGVVLGGLSMAVGVAAAVIASSVRQ